MKQTMSAHESRLYFQLQRTAALLKQVADNRLLSAAGITTAQAAVLNLVAVGGAVRQNKLAESLNQKESAVTQMVAKLGERGLISRQRASFDGRGWEVTLTDAGRSAVKKAAAAFEGVNTHLDELLSDTDQKLFVDMLMAIRKGLSGAYLEQ
ncbi:MarR family winged helix-turn-helix transcriptional regulator [Haliea sp.]